MKPKSQRDVARDTLSREVGYVRKPHAGRLRVALAFPNTYFVGMSNLGFQTIYRLFNDHPDIVCERVFLPPKQELQSLIESGARIVTLESQTPVSDFDVFAFSVSFEWDYTNVLTLLRLAGLPVRAAERTERHPLVVIGGAVTFVNPEPLALFADVIAAGEGEGADSRARRRRPRSRRLARRLLRELATTPRLLHSVVLRRRVHADGTIARYVPKDGTGAPPVVRKAAIKTTEAVDPPSTTHLHARHRVRLALPDRGRPRLREPVPVLLGGLQLPARSRVSDRAHPRPGARTPVRIRTRRAGLDRALRSPRHRAHPPQPEGHGLFDQPSVAATRRLDADHRVAAARER